MQYPGVSCGLIADPLDAWLFSMINAGNCISLALNKGYGWAGEGVGWITGQCWTSTTRRKKPIGLSRVKMRIATYFASIMEETVRNGSGDSTRVH